MAPAAESPLRTPNSKRTKPSPNTPNSPNSIDRYIRNLALEFDIRELEVGNPDSEGGKCRSGIAYLFFKDKSGLINCVNAFRKLPGADRKLSSLRLLLKVEQDRSRRHGSASGTPATNRRSNATSFNTDVSSAARSFDTLFSRQDKSAATSFTTTSGDDLATSFGPVDATTSFQVPPQPPSPTPAPRPRRKSLKHPVSPPVLKRNGDIRKSFKPTNDPTTSKVTDHPLSSEPPQSARKQNITSFYNQTKSVPPNAVASKDTAAIKLDVASAHAGEDVIQKDQVPVEPRVEKQRLEHWQTRTLPDGQFFLDDLPKSYHNTPLRLRYEALRYAVHYGIELEELDQQFPNGIRDLKDVQKQLTKACVQGQKKVSLEEMEAPLWDAADDSKWPAGLTLHAKLDFRMSKDLPALRLSLKPMQKHAKTNRFFRKFGANRFLRVAVPVPDTKDCPKMLDPNKYLEAIIKWLVTPGKRLLGCSWTAVFVKPGKATTKKKERFGEPDGREVFFFAEKGPGLETISISQMMQWFMDFELNKEMPACKLYSRLELGFSSTIPTLVFRPDQIMRVPNVKSDGAPGDISLRDSALDWSAVDDPSAKRDMNDGCDMISAAAAAEVWNIMKGQGPVPSAFQARIGPYKGVWMVASPQHQGGTVAYNDIWIRVNDTQTKFAKHDDDKHVLRFDPLRLSFDVVTYSHSPKQSSFYHEFMPILRDRGVPLDECIKIVLESLDTAKDEAKNALDHSIKFLRWIQAKRAQLSTFEGGTEWCGAHEKTRPMMLQTLIQSGFKVRECAYLNSLAIQEVKWHMTDASNELRITIPKSTSLIGVADPEGVLEPDQIHLSFSDAKVWGSSVLDRVNALVSRHPACRASDIQKVRIIHHHRLAHLRDVVVFPVKGCFPLASKLQGGDYDGDTFWVCWEPALVDKFLNAPPPADDPDPHAFGIAIDRSKVAYYQEWGDFTTRFLQRNFELQLQPSFLGKVTNLHKRVRYTFNSMWHKAVLDLANMHDLLVDSSKNGYTFTEENWNGWRRTTTAIRGVKDPRYDRAPNINLEDDGQIKFWKKLTDIIDILIFEVARRRCREILREISETASTDVKFDDVHLGQIWTGFNSQTRLTGTLRNLKDRFKSESYFYEPWRDAARAINVAEHKMLATDEIKTTSFNAARRECRRRFLRLQPIDCDEAVSQLLTYQPEQHGLSLWTKIKACALYEEWKRRPTFYFPIAGEVLCKMKAESFSGTESFVARVACDTKVRKRKFAEIDEEETEKTSEKAEELDAISDQEDADFVTAYEGDDAMMDVGADTDMDDEVPTRTSPAAEEPGDTAHEANETVPGQLDLSGSTQYSWPEVPAGTPKPAPSLSKSDTAPQEQIEFSQLSTDYSQLELEEEEALQEMALC